MQSDFSQPVASDEGSKEVAVLFVDLVNSSAFASVLGLEEYALHLDDFHNTCRSQCKFYFDEFCEGEHIFGRDYNFHITGDELLVFMHSRGDGGSPQNDVYQLTCLAVTLKAAWLTSPRNKDRIRRRAPVADISAGIHHGPLWCRKEADGSFRLNGYGINVAKRIESLSRNGQHYRIFLSDQAFKQIHHRVRNLIFTPRLRFEAKGILGDIGMYEVAHSFIDPRMRMAPVYFTALMEESFWEIAIKLATQDLWIHDLYQVWSAIEKKCVTDDAMEIAKQVLRHSPQNPCALYHIAQGYMERNQLEMSEIALMDLTKYWPHFADGFLDLGRLWKKMGKPMSDETLLRSVYLGATMSELPDQ